MDIIVKILIYYTLPSSLVEQGMIKNLKQILFHTLPRPAERARYKKIESTKTFPSDYEI